MKRITSLLFLLIVSVGAFAQNSYVNINAYSYGYIPNVFVLSGDVPTTLKYKYQENETTIGKLLNELSNNGFHVEFVSAMGFVSGSSGGNFSGMVYLLSKKSSTPSQIIQKENVDDDSEVEEVARFNLQGMPISKNERGFQIIVYSNYTTKTIIVE